MSPTSPAIRNLSLAEVDAVSGGIGFLVPLIVVVAVLTAKCSAETVR